MRALSLAAFLAACSGSAAPIDAGAVRDSGPRGDAQSPIDATVHAPPDETCAERFARVPDLRIGGPGDGCRVPSYPLRRTDLDDSAWALGSMCWRVVSAPASAGFGPQTEIETGARTALGIAGFESAQIVERHWTAMGLVESAFDFDSHETPVRVADVDGEVLAVAVRGSQVVWRTAEGLGAGDALVAPGTFVAGPSGGHDVLAVSTDGATLTAWDGESTPRGPIGTVPDTGAPVLIAGGGASRSHVIVGADVYPVTIGAELALGAPWTLPAVPDDAVVVGDTLLVRTDREVLAYAAYGGGATASPIARADALAPRDDGQALALDGDVVTLLGYEPVSRAATVTRSYVLAPGTRARVGAVIARLGETLVGRTAIAMDPAGIEIGASVADAALALDGEITAAAGDSSATPGSDGVVAVRHADGTSTIWRYLPRYNPCE